MSWVTAVENSDSSGYIRRDSPIRTTATPFAFSVVRFIRYSAQSLPGSLVPSLTRGRAPAPPQHRLLVLQTFQLARQLEPAAIDPRLHRALRQPEVVGNFLVRQLLKVAQHDRRPQRVRERFQRLLQLRAQILVFGERIWRALARGRLQVGRVHLARDRLPFLAH